MSLLIILSCALLSLFSLAIADFNPCNRTDNILSCPYEGVCEFPPDSCYNILLTPNAPKGYCPPASCIRNYLDWGNGITSTGMESYSATLENGTRIVNPWSCDVRSEIYGANCTSGFACQRSWTRAPIICSPVYPPCGANGTECAVDQKCVDDPRPSSITGTPGSICVSANKTCTMDYEWHGSGGDLGRHECGLFGTCVNGFCMDMIDCGLTKNASYGCPKTTGWPLFDYSAGYQYQPGL